MQETVQQNYFNPTRTRTDRCWIAKSYIFSEISFICWFRVIRVLFYIFWSLHSWRNWQSGRHGIGDTAVLRWLIPVVLYSNVILQKSYTAHTVYRFSRLLLLVLLTGHHQAFVLSRAVQWNLYFHREGWVSGVRLVNKAKTSNLENLYRVQQK
jgi:hypothetical protein